MKKIKNSNKGFSLVELIVVIAIMAVMTAVLAPALLQYVEKSRAQKDDSAMGEVVQVVKLALADQDVYDECLCYTVDGNKAYYTVAGDEEQWQPAGTMRGLTITFHATPNANTTQFGLAGGKVNEFVAEGTESFNGTVATGATLGTMTSGASTGELYNKVKAGIEDGIVDLTSQTYRNSDYTIFISMGAAEEAVVVTGQWCGTNLSADGSGGQVDNGYNHDDPALHPDDGSIPVDGATYEDEYYDYTYSAESNGWSVKVKDTTLPSYGEIKESINGKPVTNMYITFMDCTNLTTAPTIPSSVNYMGGTFWGCTSLETAPTIPSGITDIYCAFADCTNLKTYVGSQDADGNFSKYVIPNSVINMADTFSFCTNLTNAPTIPSSVMSMKGTFYCCTSLETAPTIPSDVTNMRETFYNCTSLTTAPTIPSSVTNMRETFSGCTNLTGEIEINANNLNSFSQCFYKTEKQIVLTGSSSKLAELAATAYKGNVTVK